MKRITLHITGLDSDGHQVALLADHGFDDALITQERAGGRGTIEIDVDGPVTREQVRELISRVGGWTDARVIAVGPSVLVTAADVAERVGRTRQNITQLAAGARGPGGWPHPVNPDARAPLWEWGQVAQWLNTNLDASIPEQEIDSALTIGWINAVLRLARDEVILESDRPLHDQAQRMLHAS